MAVQWATPGPDPDDDGPRLAAAATPAFRRSLPATTDNVGPLRRAVGEFAGRHGASHAALDAVRLALSEALTNVAVHAYRDAQEPGPLLVVATVHDGALDVTVADEGCGMVPRADSPGLGLGLGLIAEVAQAFDVVPRGAHAGVVLRMRFALAG